MPASRIWLKTVYAIAFAHSKPVVDGHTVVVSREHVGSIHELPTPNQKDFWALVSEVRSRLLMGLVPSGFSIGFLDGITAAHAVSHAAVHIVPRREGEEVMLPAGLEWVTGGHDGGKSPGALEYLRPARG